MNASLNLWNILISDVSEDIEFLIRTVMTNTFQKTKFVERYCTTLDFLKVTPHAFFLGGGRRALSWLKKLKYYITKGYWHLKIKCLHIFYYAVDTFFKTYIYIWNADRIRNGTAFLAPLSDNLIIFPHLVVRFYFLEVCIHWNIFRTFHTAIVCFLLLHFLT